MTPNPADPETAETVSHAQPFQRSNAARYVWAHGLQNVGDQIVAAKTLLPWLLQSAGAPAFFIAMLVPIRESGSMLPQAALTPWVKTRRRRTAVWSVGALGQAASAALIALAALTLTGVWLGIAVVVALGCFATARALCSMASKDVQGRTIPKGQRGRISGRATMLGGVAAVIVGVLLWLVGERVTSGVVAALIGLAALSWVVALLIFRGVKEPASESESKGPNRSWWRDTWALFVRDRHFRSFVIVRSLLLVTALSTSFIVTLSAEVGVDIEQSAAGASDAAAAGPGIGVFVIAAGIAALIGGKITGLWSDRSSKAVLMYSALVGSVILLALVASAQWLPVGVNGWVFPLGFFAMSVVHASVRVARSTYVVDMAEGDKRTEYVGASNTLMGVVLLIVGAVSGVIASFGSSAALLFLAAVGMVGVAMSFMLKDVSAHDSAAI